jgi:hypothetical protein
MWQEASCLCFSLLSIFLCLTIGFFFFSHHSFRGKLTIILLFVGMRWVTCLLGIFLLLLIFVPYEIFLLFFLYVFSLHWKMTFTSSIQLPSFPLLLNIFLPN